MAMHLPNLSTDMLKITPLNHLHLPHPVNWGLGMHELSIVTVLTLLQVPKNNSSGLYDKTLGYGGLEIIWGIYGVISNLHPGRNQFC